MNEIELRSDPKETTGHGALSVPDWKILDWQVEAAPYEPIPGSDIILRQHNTFYGST